MVVEFLSLQDTMGIVLTVLSVTGATLTTTVLAALFHHRDTPLVRANNSELSFLLLVPLLLVHTGFYWLPCTMELHATSHLVWSELCDLHSLCPQ